MAVWTVLSVVLPQAWLGLASPAQVTPSLSVILSSDSLNNPTGHEQWDRDALFHTLDL